MTCHCFLQPIRRDLTSSSYTAEFFNLFHPFTRNRAISVPDCSIRELEHSTRTTTAANNSLKVNLRCYKIHRSYSMSSETHKGFSTPYEFLMSFNKPFYRYGGHIELIRFKEYYRMPRGHEHISFVFSSAFRDIFS